jgi:hypothetical protein
MVTLPGHWKPLDSQVSHDGHDDEGDHECGDGLPPLRLPFADTKNLEFEPVIAWHCAISLFVLSESLRAASGQKPGSRRRERFATHKPKKIVAARDVVPVRTKPTICRGSRARLLVYIDATADIFRRRGEGRS